MVLVLKEWLSFKEYIKKWGYLTEIVYRMDPLPNERAMRIRILGGRYGLDIIVQKDDPTFQEIQNFLDVIDAKRIEEVVDIEAFFG